MSAPAVCPSCEQGWTSSPPVVPMPCNDPWHWDNYQPAADEDDDEPRET